MNRTLLAVLTAAAFFSLAAGEGSSPWRNHRVYGWEIMTKAERREFRDEMRSYVAYEDQLAFWRRHIESMKKRAWNSGQFLDEPGEIILAGNQRGHRQVIFANYLMTSEEIEAYRAKERTAHSEEERAAFLREHEKTMKAKAWATGLPIGPTRAERKLERERIEAKAAAKVKAKVLKAKK